MMMGCDGERLPRQSSAQQFVRLWQSKLVIGDRAGLRRLNPRDKGLRPRAARRRREGFTPAHTPPRPLEAPSLVAQRKGLPPDKRPRSRTRRGPIRGPRERRSTEATRVGGPRRA